MNRLFAFLLCLVPLLALAQARLEVIEPRHRSAQELVPLLQPLVEPDGSVSAYDNKLVLRATPAQLAEVRQLLESFDRAPRQLLISVRQGSVADLREDAAGVSGTYRRGSGAIAVPRADGSLPRDVEIELRRQRSQSDSRGMQQVRVEEGREAQIQLGQSVPVVSRYRRPDGVIVERTESYDTGSGFTVLPRLQGERVQLEISVRQALPRGDGSVNVQNASSVVSGPLGEWFDVGGAVQQLNQSSRGLLSAGSLAGQREGSILVKVDEVP